MALEKSSGFDECVEIPNIYIQGNYYYELVFLEELATEEPVTPTQQLHRKHDGGGSGGR